METNTSLQLEVPVRSWTTRRDEKERRMKLVQPWMKGPILPRERITDALALLIVSNDRIVLEGDNQKQADFLSRSLVKLDPKKIHDLHLIISSISRPEQFLTLFELGPGQEAGLRLLRSSEPADGATPEPMAASSSAPSIPMSNCFPGS